MILYTEECEALIQDHCESAGLDADRYTASEDLDDLWGEFDTACREVFEKWGNLSVEHIEALWADAEPTWYTYQTLVGAGVGLWDRDWGALAGVDVDALCGFLKEELKEWADDTGGGRIREAVAECVREQMGPCPAYVTMTTDEGEASAHAFDGDTSARVVLNEDGTEPHAAPLGWCNSASIRTNPVQDSVTVSISASDPRGGFAMEVRRRGDGTILIHLPHVGESMPHAELVEIHPGTLAIKSSLPPAEPAEPEAAE